MEKDKIKIDKLSKEEKAKLIEALIGIPPKYLIPMGLKIRINIADYELNERKQFFEYDPKSGENINKIQKALSIFQ